MAANDRSTAQQNSDSQGGYRSLAGYVYQLLGSVAEAVELVRLDSNACAIEGLITLEQFGQDSFVALVPGTNESRLTQYKHSSSETEIEPSELLIILERFVSATTLGGLSIAKCQYQLRTNRKAHSLTDELLNKQKTYKQDPTIENEQELLSDLWKRRRTARPECGHEMFEIMKKLVWLTVDETSMKKTIERHAAELGVPSAETDQQIRETLGLFLDRVNSIAYRTISRRDLNDKLAGHRHARPLRGEVARREQRESVLNAINRIHHHKPLARRRIVEDIAVASLASPLVLVVGDGGRGKSVASWQALLGHLQNEDQPPDFVAGYHFGEFTENQLINDFAQWRNQTPGGDGTTLDYALSRLSAGCPHANLLVLYVDGIDEKEGKPDPFPTSKRFIERLLQDFVNRREDQTSTQISLVVSCRTFDEADWLTGIAGEQGYSLVPVNEFTNLELEELAKGLNQSPRDILLPMVSPDRNRRQRFSEDADDNLIRPLREPRVWASFTELDSAMQTEYLTGSPQGKRQLAKKLLKRIEIKASHRLAMDLRQNVVEAILEAAGRTSIRNPTEVCTQSQWFDVCSHEHFSRSNAMSLFDEFVTAGLFNVESENGKRWSWKQIWLRESLCSQEVAQ